MKLSQDGHLVRKQVLKLHDNSFAETQDRNKMHESSSPRQKKY
jgi:cytochrome c-type biogenesis protein CcmE